MREILFRGKRIDNGGWVHGSLFPFRNKSCAILPSDSKAFMPKAKGFICCEECYEVDPATVCQYTGLTDKNGVRIFDGDIVRFQLDNDDCPFPNKQIEKIIGKVFYSDWRASFSVTMGENLSDIVNNDLYNYIRGGNRVEVIGNIHDNPELREEELA